MASRSLPCVRTLLTPPYHDRGGARYCHKILHVAVKTRGDVAGALEPSEAAFDAVTLSAELVVVAHRTLRFERDGITGLVPRLSSHARRALLSET